LRCLEKTQTYFVDPAAHVAASGSRDAALDAPKRGATSPKRPLGACYGSRIHTIDSLPDLDGQYFVTAGICENCHGHDPNGLGLVDAQGRDINMADDWKSTMMANSAKDPFWRAQVSHEVITNPALQSAIEDKCTSCHAPLGRYTHFFETHGQTDYSMAQLAYDTLGLDGVSCMSCHSQKQDSLGYAFSGKLLLDTARTVYGPFPGPVIGPMFTANNLIAAYGPHIQDSKLCAGCHTLMTQTVDLQGSVTSNWFAEQATYHEWVNSNYVNLDISCQTCHMPSVNDFVYLSYPHISSTNPRRPIFKHHFAGSNTQAVQRQPRHRGARCQF
jgi:Cytochrome c554 and c-prime